MEEALEVILTLLRTEEPVTHDSEWFTLREARLHLRPYTDPHPEVAVAAMISPAAWRMARTVSRPRAWRGRRRVPADKT